MDESLQEFEAELKALKPHQLDPKLAGRIASNLAASGVEGSTGQRHRATPSDPFMSRRWLNLGVVGIAASVAVVVAVVRSSLSEKSAVLPEFGMVAKTIPSTKNEPTESPSSENAYQPVAASNVLYEMKDEGPAAVKGDGSDRRVRYRYVDTYTWKNPRNNASLTWSVPRDEIRVQPAQFN